MPTITELFDQAVRFHQGGNLPGAESLYREILRADPRNINALHLLGILANQMGRFDVGIPLIRQAIALNPSVPDFHANLSLALFEQGNVFYRQGQFAQAAECYRQVLRINPNHADADNNLGNALFGQGQMLEAAACFRQTLQINPNHAHAHFNLGNVLVGLKQLAEATQYFRQAIGVNPSHTEAHYHLGLALVGQELFAEAAECFRKVLRMKPDHADAHFNLGVIYFGDRQLVEADECFRQALRINPDNAMAHFQQGIVLWEQRHVAEAMACYRRALKLQPDFADAHGNLLYALHFCPDYTAPMIHEEHRLWYQSQAQPLAKFIQPHGDDPTPGRRLRIGYVSPNFGMQSETFFTMPLFANHNHEAFEIFCYADVANPDEITSRLRSHADVWRSIVGLTDHEVAQLVRDDRIDILVDLTMHMAKRRLLAYARKPAPVQVCWLAYQGTTGLATMDYRLTDAYVDPPDLFDAYYTEQSIRLPDAFGCYDPLTNEPAINALPALEKGFITFGSFNNLFKLNDGVLRLWATVLRMVGNSRMTILADRGTHRQNILDFFARENVANERIDFVARRPRQEYLELFHGIDICLDTFPYNGQTTTLDSLWMGVPVLTLVGQTAVGRAGLSILQNLGIPEWIAETPEQFVRNAVNSSGNLEALSRFRATLRERLSSSPLMNGPRFARNVETAYRNMWHAWCAGARV